MQVSGYKFSSFYHCEERSDEAISTRDCHEKHSNNFEHFSRNDRVGQVRRLSSTDDDGTTGKLVNSFDCLIECTCILYLILTTILIGELANW